MLTVCQALLLPRRPARGRRVCQACSKMQKKQTKRVSPGRGLPALCGDLISNAAEPEPTPPLPKGAPPPLLSKPLRRNVDEGEARRGGGAASGRSPGSGSQIYRRSWQPVVAQRPSGVDSGRHKRAACGALVHQKCCAFEYISSSSVVFLHLNYCHTNFHCPLALCFHRHGCTRKIKCSMCRPKTMRLGGKHNTAVMKTRQKGTVLLSPTCLSACLCASRPSRRKVEMRARRRRRRRRSLSPGRAPRRSTCGEPRRASASRCDTSSSTRRSLPSTTL